MAALFYWTGDRWEPIASGGGGGGGMGPPGPQGPAGPAGQDGKSVRVFVQPAQPTPDREGDIWINNAARSGSVSTVAPSPVGITITSPTSSYPSFDAFRTYPSLDDMKGS